MPTTAILVGMVVFAGVFTQSLAGFGVALVSMAVLPGLIGMQTAAPLVALVALTLEGLLLFRYRGALRFKTVLPLALASFVGIPLGVWGLRKLDETLVLAVLGAVIAGYGLYALSGFRLPALQGAGWGYGAGFLAGLLGGAYNTAGPPVVIYGDSQRWERDLFRGNLQAFFLLNDIVVVATHAWMENLTSQVWQGYFWSLPAILLGILAGIKLDRIIKPAVFRALVLVLLVILGLRLIFLG